MEAGRIFGLAHFTVCEVRQAIKDRWAACSRQAQS